jgi:hypothetical protein
MGENKNIFPPPSRGKMYLFVMLFKTLTEYF